MGIPTAIIVTSLLALSTLAIHTAHARLGWTMEQREKFYGPVYVELDSKVGEHVYEWEKDGINIDCVMLENKVVQNRVLR